VDAESVAAVAPGRPPADERTSLEKGLAILHEIAARETSPSVAQLAESTGLNRTTVYRLCDVLERDGWIQPTPGKDRRQRRVDLGPRALGLAVLANTRYDPEARLEPLMQALAERVGETVHAGILDGASVIHVALAVPDSGPHLAVALGARAYAHATALGKAMLATLPRQEILERYRQEELPKRTSTAIGNRSALLEDLERIVECGYALDDEESRIGVRCLGVPIFGPSGRAVFAMSVTTTPVNLEGERITAVAAALQECAARATASLGGTVPAAWVSLT
jgi:DNA-binding IclR family transcriptional regulator